MVVVDDDVVLDEVVLDDVLLDDDDEDELDEVVVDDGGGPLDTMTVTVLPRSTSSPWGGSVPIT